MSIESGGPSSKEMGIESTEAEPQDSENESQEEEERESGILRSEMHGEEFQTKKEAGQQELRELFGMEKTSDFQKAINEGRIDDALAWLQHIEKNGERFPQYDDDWAKDRRGEIGQAELQEKFGMKKTADFRTAIDEGRIEDAKAWFKFIEKNPGKFPQYDDNWFADRKKELGE